MARRITSKEVLHGILPLDYEDSGDDTDNASVDDVMDQEQQLTDKSDDAEVPEEETEVRTSAGREGTQLTIIVGGPKRQIGEAQCFHRSSWID